MPTKTQVDLTLVEHTCHTGSCSIAYWLPEVFVERRRKNHATFYCPNGHGQLYPQESEEERLRRELRDARLDAHAEAARARRLEGDLLTKAKEMKLFKRRIKSGTCPHCRRHFANVERHMNSKHPEQEP